MRFSMRMAVLFASAAMWFLAPAVRADFSMRIVDNSTGMGFKIQGDSSDSNFTLTKLGGYTGAVTFSGDSGKITAQATIDGYTFDVIGRSNEDASPTPSSAVVSFDATVKKGEGATATSFNYFVADSPFTFPGNSSSTVYMKASLFTNPDSANFSSGNQVKTQGHYVTGSTEYTTTTAGPLSEANQSASSNTVTISPRGNEFTLSDLGGIIEVNGKGPNVKFFAQAVVSLPEPAAVLIGLLGVPCMGLVVFFARRRTVSTAAAMA
jgi:hypothetical protein